MKQTLTIIIFTLATAYALSQDTETQRELPPELRTALLRDAACGKPAVVKDKDEDQVVTQQIRGASGLTVGVIAAPQNGCHCHDGNCGTYVYLKRGAAYKLAFSGVFASLHPMKAFKGGYPSLTGKMQVDDSRAETTIYDWNGAKYEPSLCATITQVKNQKRPSIVRHGCKARAR